MSEEGNASSGGATVASAPAPAASAAPAPTQTSVVAAPVPAPAADDKSAKSNEGYWPADWRQNVSKADTKILARLERYSSPEAAMNALIAAQNRISAGELKPVLGKNTTPEQLAEYRQAHGIPETPDKYDLGKDLVLGEEDTALAAEIFKAAHETNQTPEQVKASLKTIKSLQQNTAAQRFEDDKRQATEGEESLRAEWGPEYRRNINLAHGLLDGAAPQGLKDKFLNGRMEDGTRIGSSPEVIRMLVDLALIKNPTGVVVPGAEANPLQGVEGEIGKIEKTMRENRSAYNKDEKMQARYRELIGAREQLKPRKSA